MIHRGRPAASPARSRTSSPKGRGSPSARNTGTGGSNLGSIGTSTTTATGARLVPLTDGRLVRTGHTGTRSTRLVATATTSTRSPSAYAGQVETVPGNPGSGPTPPLAASATNNGGTAATSSPTETRCRNCGSVNLCSHATATHKATCDRRPVSTSRAETTAGSRTASDLGSRSSPSAKGYSTLRPDPAQCEQKTAIDGTGLATSTTPVCGDVLQMQGYGFRGTRSSGASSPGATISTKTQLSGALVLLPLLQSSRLPAPRTNLAPTFLLGQSPVTPASRSLLLLLIAGVA